MSFPLSKKMDPAYVFVLLGASNLARGYSALTRHLSESIAPDAVQFLTALGPGRGYCARGGLLNFSYSPIGECKMMQSESLKSSGRVVVLITDIGNDIMYGVSDVSLIGCLDALIENSLRWKAEIFVTSIHVDASKDLGKISFKLLKEIFYPKSSVTFEQVDVTIKKVNQYLQNKTAQNKSLHLLEGLGVYSGFDKIHYGLFKSHLAWSCIANDMLVALNKKPVGKIGFGSIVISLCENLSRLFTVDMLRIKKRQKGFF